MYVYDTDDRKFVKIITIGDAVNHYSKTPRINEEIIEYYFKLFFKIDEEVVRRAREIANKLDEEDY